MGCSGASGVRGSDGGESGSSGARGSDGGEVDAAWAADSGNGGDMSAVADGLRCVGGFIPSLSIPPRPCGVDQICCVLADTTSACLARAMGCPALIDNPAGRQLCTTTAECVVPGDVCAFPDNPGLSAETCSPPRDDDGGIISDSEASDGSDGAAEATIVDAAAKDDGG
jgi:hypothetical protein